MTRFFETIKMCHNAIVSAAEAGTDSRSHAILFAVCMEIVFVMMFVSAWPLWWFLLKVGVILAVIAGVVEFALRVVYRRKDRHGKEEISETTAVAGGSPRLNVACSDAQGRLRKSHISDEQADRMAQTILRNHSVSRTSPPFLIGKSKFRALRRFIHETLN